MSKSFFRFVLIAAIGAMVAMPAIADTDYPCLNACVAGGKSSSACLSQCTHDPVNVHNHRVQSHTDYRCIDICKSGGKSASACLSQCTYTDTVTNASHPPTSGGAALAKHELLEAPVPAGNAFIEPHKNTTSKNSGKNYNCINQCLHDGMQYQLCNQNCTAVTPGFSDSH